MVVAQATLLRSLLPALLLCFTLSCVSGAEDALRRPAQNTTSNLLFNRLSRETPALLFSPQRNKECAVRISPTWPKVDDSTCFTGETNNFIQMHAACYDMWERLPTLNVYSNKIYGVGGVFGHMGKGALMSKADYIILDFVFGAHQEAANILEFGTALGVTSLYLGMVARMRGGQLVTYDYLDTDCRSASVKKGWLDNMHFKQDDLLATRAACKTRGPEELAGTCVPCSASVARDVAGADVFLVDNGEKIREASLYAKYLRRGGVIMVHDHCGPWGEAYEDLLPPFGFKPVYGPFASHIGSCLRAWVRTAGDVLPPPTQRGEACHLFGAA
jgi:hypothetical protein